MPHAANNRAPGSLVICYESVCDRFASNTLQLAPHTRIVLFVLTRASAVSRPPRVRACVLLRVASVCFTAIKSLASNRYKMYVHMHILEVCIAVLFVWAERVVSVFSSICVYRNNHSQIHAAGAIDFSDTNCFRSPWNVSMNSRIQHQVLDHFAYFFTWPLLELELNGPHSQPKSTK